MDNYSTIKEEGYRYIDYLGHKEHLLQDEDGKYEIWFANRNHASFGLKYRNTHLEFARSVDKEATIKLNYVYYGI